MKLPDGVMTVETLMMGDNEDLMKPAFELLEQFREFDIPSELQADLLTLCGGIGSQWIAGEELLRQGVFDEAEATSKVGFYTLACLYTAFNMGVYYQKTKEK